MAVPATSSAADATLRAAQVHRVAAQATYVALGDSFSSGEGNRSSGWVDWTGITGNLPPNHGCDRSPIAYPEIVRSWLSHDPSVPKLGFDFYACSGATSTDVWPGSPARSLGLQGATSNNGESPELSHGAAIAEAKMVTISIGGNDVNFPTVVKACVVGHYLGSPAGEALAIYLSGYLGLSPETILALAKSHPSTWCTSKSPIASVRNLLSHVSVLHNALEPTLDRIRLLAPHASIFVLGYPDLVPLHPSKGNLANGCNGVPGNGIGYLATVERALHDAVQAAAGAVNVHFVDPNIGPWSFGSHTLCASDRWFNRLALVPTVGIPPVKASPGSYHPNQRGQFELAQAVEAAIGSPLTFPEQTLPDGALGSSYSGYLRVNGGTTPFEWAVTSALPEGITMSSAGILSGTPLVAGTSSFVATVTDGIGRTASRSVSLTIDDKSGSASWQSPFSGPTTVVADGADVWVANSFGSTIAELQASTGSVVRVLSNPAYNFKSYGFYFSWPMVSDGTHLWVANSNNTVTEIDESTGTLVQVLTSPSYGFDNPEAVASDGSHLWVLNGGGTVTEIDESSGALVRVLSSPSYQLQGPIAIAADGGNLWIANWSGDTVTEINAATASLVRVLSGSSYGFSGPRYLAADGTHLWIANSRTNTVTEVEEASGAAVQVLMLPSFGRFADTITSMTSDGSHLWVGSWNDWDFNGVMEISESTGAFVRVLQDSSFDDPAGLASSGSDLWVANEAFNGVTKVNEANGFAVLTHLDPGYMFAYPTSTVSDGTHLWVSSCWEGFTSCDFGWVNEIDESTGALVQVLSGAPYGQYGFNDPTAMASDGSHLWIANSEGNSLTEVDESTGALVQVLTGSQYGFTTPTGLASDGTHLWVANENGNSVTEIDESTGALVQVLTGSQYGFTEPWAMASDGTHLWIGNRLGNSVTEVDESTGALVQVLTGSQYGFKEPWAMTSDGTQLWVANGAGDSVTEVNESTGALVRVLSGPSYGFIGPSALASTGTHLWVASGQSLTEVNESSGAVIRVITSPSYGFRFTAAGIASDAAHLWVANTGSDFSLGNSVTEIDLNSGDLVQQLWGS
jgi:hypothetical protein